MFRNSLVVMCAGVNPKFARYSPGLLSMYNQIKIFLEEQHLDSIDFTRGNEKYKYDLEERMNIYIMYNSKYKR